MVEFAGLHDLLEFCGLNCMAGGSSSCCKLEGVL